jgi:Zn-finger nucleic acid-binding protein
MPIDFPRCVRSELKPVREKSSGITLGACPKCNGLWFSGGDLPKLLHVQPTVFAPPPSALHGHRRCPLCKERMCAFRFPDTLFEIEVCETCKGVFLDEGEYEEIRKLAGR